MSPNAAASPPRWLRTLPWLVGLLVGATAHIVWWSHAWSEAVIAQQDVPSIATPASVSPRAPAAVPPRIMIHPQVSTAPVERRADVRPACHTTRMPARGVRGAVVCSGNGCTIRRTFLSRLLDDPRMLSTSAWRAGVEPDGSASLTIDGVYPGSVAEVLGLRDGDTILAVNGKPLGYAPEPGPPTGPLSKVDALNVTLRRQGELETFHYTLIDE